MNNTIVPIPTLLEHQAPIGRHPARFKVLRMGRRWGKDRLAFNAAWFGHGDGGAWAGILEGWNVAWLAPDFKQGRGIWDEEIIPRFVDHQVPGIEVNQQEKTVTLAECGGLYFYSAENARAIRGLGKRLKGIVINEAAHLDLAHIWREIVRPVLADNEGWALIMSTTNSGADGGLDDTGNKRVPSYFNTLCEEIRAGKRSKEWEEFHGAADQNPKIKPKEFQALIAEYPQGSTALNEEVYANLLTAGAGLAFPEWRDEIHTLERFDVPAHWQFGGGLDWGYWQPSIFTVVAHGEESQSVVMADQRWTQTDGFDIGVGIATMCLTLPKRIEYIAADSSIWGVQAKKGFPNLAEEIQSGLITKWAVHKPTVMAPVLVAVPKGVESRLTRANLLHKYLKWMKAADGTLVVHPRLQFLKSCANCMATIPKLPTDPKKPEDVDTTADDHAYDALTYFLLSRPPLVEAPVAIGVDQDKHPGFDPLTHRRKKPWEDAWQPEKPDTHWVPGKDLERLTTW